MKTLTFSTAALSIASAAALTFISTPVQAQTAALPQALIVQDNVPLRAAPRDSANSQAHLWQGELVELRGERMDYVQVWDYKRERGGYVRASQLRRISFAPTDADNLLSVLRFVKDTPGSEGLSFGYSAAWLKAASAQQINSAAGAEVLDAIGTAAERLARRASTPGLSKNAQDSVAAQLDAAQRYGIRFESFSHADVQDGKVTICYDGDVFARVLALPSASSEQRARAALALTRSDCEDPHLAIKQPAERSKNEEWRAAVLDKAQAQDLSAYVANRLHLRRASVWSTVAFDRSRSGSSAAAQAAAQRSLDALASVNKAELPDDDTSAFNDAVMRVNASRWAAAAAVPNAGRLQIHTTPGAEPGQTCVSLQDEKKTPLAQRCTYGLVWAASMSVNREANAVALAVQPLAAWREMWLFRKQAGGWSIDVLPPSATQPELGYAELAGWVPGGQQVLLARESRGEGKYKRSYEVIDLSTLNIQRQATDPSILGAFQRWQQPQWKQMSVSLR
jgi:hypothetical protein